jgi:hypothetical protein
MYGSTYSEQHNMSRKVKKKAALRYYKSIDELPLYNWFEIHAKNDVTYLLHKGPRKVSQAMQVKLLLAFQKIKDEFIDCFGISDITKRLLMLKAQLQTLKIDYALNQDASMITFINVKKYEIEEIEKQFEKKVDYMVNKSYVQKWLGIHINIREYTVREYYSDIKAMNAELSKQPKSQGKGRK